MTGTLTSALAIRARLALRPPPRLHLSDWAEQHFYLSPESSAEAGKWKTIPYQRGIINHQHSDLGIAHIIPCSFRIISLAYALV